MTKASMKRAEKQRSTAQPKVRAAATKVVTTNEAVITASVPSKNAASTAVVVSKAVTTAAKPTDQAAVVRFEYPRCDAAVRKLEYGMWELADAIVAECSEPGENGVANDSQAKMEAMRKEIAKNHGIDLSLERIRKLRKVAAAFSAGRRRPGVSLEAHLEAGTPEALEEFIKSTPDGTAITREHIRRLKHPDEDAEQDRQDDERQRQAKDHRTALQSVCRQLERQVEQQERRYEDLCRSIGKEPEPFTPPSQEDGPPRTVAEDLEQLIRAVLMSRGFDPAAASLKQAVQEFVQAVVAQ